MKNAPHLTHARINISLTINKLMIKMKHSSTSDLQRQGLQVMIDDLEVALNVLKDVSKENEELYTLNSSLHIQNMRLKKQILDLTKPKENIEI